MVQFKVRLDVLYELSSSWRYKSYLQNCSSMILEMTELWGGGGVDYPAPPFFFKLESYIRPRVTFHLVIFMFY